MRVVLLAVVTVASMSNAQTPCPAGMAVTAETGGNCCWPGQVWAVSRSVCVGAPACPEGFKISGDSCVAVAPAPAASSPCTGGQIIGADTAGRCCWPMQAWSTARNACVGSPACPAGTTAHDETCVPLAVAGAVATAAPQGDVDTNGKPVHYERHVRLGLLIAGIGLFVLSYATAAVIGGIHATGGIGPKTCTLRGSSGNLNGCPAEFVMRAAPGPDERCASGYPYLFIPFFGGLGAAAATPTQYVDGTTVKNCSSQSAWSSVFIGGVVSSLFQLGAAAMITLGAIGSSEAVPNP